MNAGTDRPSSPTSAPPQPSNPASRVHHTSHTRLLLIFALRIQSVCTTAQ
jgi:hypothetical protein